jgi:hypothetical protein
MLSTKRRLSLLRTVPVILMALMVFAVAVPSASGQSLGKNWKVYNGEPATARFWDIDKPLPLSGGVLQFPIQQFLSPTTGSFAIYVLNNYNVDITGRTFNMTASWTPGVYETRSTTCSGAHVRFEFQDVTASSFTSSDYWWSTVSLDLNAVSYAGAPMNLTASLDRTLWTNICGQSATDTTPHPGANCVGTTDPNVSPYDGFTAAMKDTKQLGLSFGSDCRYASGVALDGGTGMFQLHTFSIAP